MTGHFREGPGYRTVRSTGATSWLMMMTLRGQGFVRGRDFEISLTRHQAALLVPGEYHDYGVPASGEWEFLWAHFHPPIRWGEWNRWPSHGSSIFLLDEAPEPAIAAFFQAVNDGLSGLARKEELGMNSMERVFLLTGEDGNAVSLDPRIQTVVRYIGANLPGNLDVNHLSKVVGLSPSRLAHLFRDSMKSSLRDYVERQRMERAQTLLTLTDSKVQSIAEQVGFSDPFHFSERFLRLTGQRPTDFRKSKKTLKPVDFNGVLTYVDEKRFTTR